MTSLRGETAETGLAIIQSQIKPEPLTQTDYEKIKQVLRPYRNLLLCMILRATGLRINEMLRVQADHIQREGPTISLLIRRSKKGDKVLWEHMYLPPQLGVQLVAYVEGNSILPGQRIFGITSRMVRYIFEKAGKTAIGRPVHPHEFRGLYTKTLIDGGLPVEAAAKMLGHDDTKTTMKHYYDLTRIQREEIQRRIPV